MSKKTLFIVSGLGLLLVLAASLLFYSYTFGFASETEKPSKSRAVADVIVTEGVPMATIYADDLDSSQPWPKCAYSFGLDWEYDPFYTVLADSEEIHHLDFSAQSIDWSHPAIVLHNESTNYIDNKAYLNFSCLPREYAEPKTKPGTWEFLQTDSFPVDKKNIPFLDKAVLDTVVEARGKVGYKGYYFLLAESGDVYDFYFIGKEIVEEQNPKIILTESEK